MIALEQYLVENCLLNQELNSVVRVLCDQVDH